MVSGNRCDTCGFVSTAVRTANTPHTRWTANLPTARCSTCEQADPGHPSRGPVLVGEILAATADVLMRAGRSGTAVPDTRSSSSTTCKACGGQAEWHRTVRGRWIMIEPGDRPTHSIPAGKRWRIAGDGTAVNLGSAAPSDTCRISHFDVCPSRPAPVDSPTLLALWRGNAQRQP
ncbi:DUF6083 domain-containing protein [Streptomyces sp. NPDC050095]|uniref:DUF6083 domain-containing protein n=1 Tax=unclassified Streptomyces TaxID=2593676 RepID=UPI00341D4AAC